MAWKTCRDLRNGRKSDTTVQEVESDIDCIMHLVTDTVIRHMPPFNEYENCSTHVENMMKMGPVVRFIKRFGEMLIEAQNETQYWYSRKIHTHTKANEDCKCKAQGFGLLGFPEMSKVEANDLYQNCHDEQENSDDSLKVYSTSTLYNQE